MIFLFNTKRNCCISIVVVIILSSFLTSLVVGKGKGSQTSLHNLKIRGKKFCQKKYEECMIKGITKAKHHHDPKLKTTYTSSYCERKIYRNYYCKTRIPELDNTTIYKLKPKPKPVLRNRSLGFGQISSTEIQNDTSTDQPEFYIDPPQNVNSSEVILMSISEESEQ